MGKYIYCSRTGKEQKRKTVADHATLQKGFWSSKSFKTPATCQSTIIPPVTVVWHGKVKGKMHWTKILLNSQQDTAARWQLLHTRFACVLYIYWHYRQMDLWYFSIYFTALYKILINCWTIHMTWWWLFYLLDVPRTKISNGFQHKTAGTKLWRVPYNCKRLINQHNATTKGTTTHQVPVSLTHSERQRHFSFWPE